MTKTIALVTIHGMGDTARDYYAEFYEVIKKSLGKTTWDKVIFKPIYYQDILQGQQEAIFNRMKD
jgi:aspartate/glutamate racemase